MVEVTCKHSDIKFEAKTKRTKQHPKVADFKNEAARVGDYPQAIEALKKATEAGGYETIEEYVQLAQDIMDGKVDEKRAKETARLEAKEKAEKARIEAKRQREATNRHLKENGYVWFKEPVSVTDFHEGEKKWVLYSPDNRAVTVAQALDEIERGADVVQDELAEIIENAGELPYNVILSGKLAKAEANRKQKQTKARETMDQLWETAKGAVKNEMTEVENFNYDGFEVSFKQNNKMIYRGMVNGVECGVIYNYRSYGNDFDIVEQFYSVAPAQAGLKPVEREGMEKSWMKFFGE